MLRIYSLFVLGLLCYPAFSQNESGTSLRIQKARGEITLDGQLDEADWQRADVADNWYLNYPVDTMEAPFQSEARMTFDDTYLYAGVICYDDTSRDIINSLRRDFDWELNDNMTLVIGSFNDKLNGFFFSVTPRGVQMEGIVAQGGDYNSFWDNKWYSKVVRLEDRWVIEMAIPFKSFRYKEGLSEWNINFVRADRKRNSLSAWIATPIQFDVGALAFSGQLAWETPAPPPKTNISLIPYLAGGVNQNPSGPGSGFDPDTRLAAGFDGKIGITPSLNLDLTVNPDFSQVEVDQQVINLSRFEIRLPERRQFFLENNDLTSQAGFPSARPFFSRRVGLVQDSSGLFQQVPILFGARLSGSFNEKWRTSVMNLQTREDLNMGLPAQNYSVATVARNFGAQSSAAVTFVNKLSMGVSAEDTAKFFNPSIFRRVTENGNTQLRPNTFNRVLSLDLDMLSKDNRWYHSSFISRSFDDFSQQENLAGSAFLRYQVREFEVFGGMNYIGENFNAEAGFVPSLGVYPGRFDFFTNVNLNFYPKNDAIVVMGPRAEFRQVYLPGGPLTDREITLSYNMRFLNASELTFGAQTTYQRLTRDFNPIFEPDRSVFAEGDEIDWTFGFVSYQSNPRALFNFNLDAAWGGFYNGTNLSLSGRVNYRRQPFGNVSLQFDYNDVSLAEGFGAERLFLIGPRLDLTFTDALFLTTYVQYNSRLDNINLNARFQWRYQPASDFFIVYTENYLPQNLNSKNRALVFKLVYWLNV